MAKTLLTKTQSSFLSFFGQEKRLNRNFYLTGGTALSEYYLKHRFSEDLDFFSEKEFDVNNITPLIVKSKEILGFFEFDFQSTFNRNLYHLIFTDKKFLKVEFTYFPFPQVEAPKKLDGVLIDSLMDIAVNKLFTIYQNPRGRDYFDLYIIIKKQKWSISELARKARIKFDWQVDYLQLGTQFLKIKEIFDDPILKGEKIKRSDVEDFFLKEAKNLKTSVLAL